MTLQKETDRNATHTSSFGPVDRLKYQNLAIYLKALHKYLRKTEYLTDGLTDRPTAKYRILCEFWE